LRIATLHDRLVLITPEGAVDVHTASDGRFGPNPHSAFDDWAGFRSWADSVDSADGAAVAFDETDLGAPVPAPRQVFAVGLNYAMHANESKLDLPSQPMIFTKFPSSITGPSGSIRLTGDTVDWEVELVVVIGKEAHDVSEAEAWSYVAGLTAGQDLSDRTVQQVGSPAQFSMGKSFPGFAPIGPAVVTLDEFADPTDLELTTTVGDETRQNARTSTMVFDVPKLIAYLSGIVTLYPGDLVFTGTPDGVGLGRTPQLYLKDGDVLGTSIEGIGTMTHTLVA
jgi:2-keto-4-pentenoate hydratase/2-oxohepta-3-ene-1,7-dioic acid hydratase in catechol pathway